jgi:hypothetical protein
LVRGAANAASIAMGGFFGSALINFSGGALSGCAF